MKLIKVTMLYGMNLCMVKQYAMISLNKTLKQREFEMGLLCNEESTDYRCCLVIVD